MINDGTPLSPKSLSKGRSVKYEKKVASSVDCNRGQFRRVRLLGKKGARGRRKRNKISSRVELKILVGLSILEEASGHATSSGDSTAQR